jgi:hypothetical protein
MHGKLEDYITALLALHAACSAITALTPNPKDDIWARKFYRLIEIGALLVGRAKNG